MNEQRFYVTRIEFNKAAKAGNRTVPLRSANLKVYTAICPSALFATCVFT